MPTFMPLPGRIEAVQFTGDNWAEMHDFTGHFIPGSDDNKPSDVFISNMGDNLLWVEHLVQWVPVSKGDWILKMKHGFTWATDEDFRENWIESEEIEGPIPILDETTGDARMLGRIRMALLQSRPMSEVEAICDRLIHVFAQYRVDHEEGLKKGLVDAKENAARATIVRVLVEAGGLPTYFADSMAEKLLAEDLIGDMFHDEQTMIKVREALATELGPDEEQITNCVTSMQNAGILFRERM